MALAIADLQLLEDGITTRVWWCSVLQSYEHGTPCRWPGAYLRMVSVLRDSKAHTVTRAKRGTSAKGDPEGLIDDEFKDGAQFRTVLSPLKVGAAIIEGGPQSQAILGSVYHLVWMLKQLQALTEVKKEVLRSERCPPSEAFAGLPAQRLGLH